LNKDKNIGTYDPDNAICLYSKNDKFQSSVTSGFTQQGTGLLSMHKVTALATMPSGTSTEFVFAQVEDLSSAVIPLWKVQWIKLTVQGQSEGWDSKFYPSVDGDIDFLKINRFIQPRGVAFDPSGNLFVVDAGTDSLYRFSSRGIEHYSFGGHNDPYGRNFNQPYGIAYYDKTLFVADKGNNYIYRFKLSTDM
jgi:DNA-binding beta-propeller fold protein YncE